VNKARLVAAALAVLAAGAATVSRAPASESPQVRVGVAVEQTKIRIDADTLITATEATAEPISLPRGPCEFRATASGMASSAMAFGPIVSLRTASGLLRVDGRLYRGVVELRRTQTGRLTAINEVDLEQYLYGVIKGEIDPRWPPEAVKAQAIAARTLALDALSPSSAKYASEGYALRATTDSQVYLGVEGEDAAGIAAVDATRGLIMTFGGQPIFAAYHSNSGGHTEDSENVWGTVYPYLRGVSDPYALDAPGAQWTASLPVGAVEGNLRRGGIDAERLRAVVPARVTPWGRAVTVRLMEEAGRAQEISANQFRMLVGPSVIRSTMFTVTRAGADLGFSGRGSGHGVGLDQWGARAMALKGYTFEQILSYYYSGIAVVRGY
jgi:stage II sporulation protein D